MQHNNFFTVIVNLNVETTNIVLLDVVGGKYPQEIINILSKGNNLLQRKDH